MLPLFTDAFLADTGHLNAQETGAYLLLLMAAWRTRDCQLPDEDKDLARWARVDLRTWKKIKPRVMSFWSKIGGSWTQKRLAQEREKASKRADAARANGATGGRPKLLKNNITKNPAGSFEETQEKPSISISTEVGGGGDAREREAEPTPKPEVAISEAADKLAKQLGEIAGFPDRRDWPPGWCGAPRRCQTYLDAGYSVEMMLSVARAAMKSKTDGPPYSVNYFTTAFARAHAKISKPPPLPVVEIVNQEPQKVRINGTHQNGGTSSAGLGFSGLGAELGAKRAGRSR
jgi:uncharacterized protein YdaU (DUF1376 family)